MAHLCHNTHHDTAGAHSRPALRARLCGVLTSMAALLCALSCSEGEHSGYTPVPRDGWLYGDTLTVTEPADSSDVRRADIAVALRHNNSYAYSNIWLALTYSGPDSTVTDTLGITLADSFGNWLGHGMGVSYQKIDTVLTDVAIDMGKPVRINHIMRADTLNGIEQVGVVIIDK